ncbi:MAG: hypothetical protein NC127_03640 [Muribaculum sp.]|nr:hypothetical protein [Muribaculum sp.]
MHSTMAGYSRRHPAPRHKLVEVGDEWEEIYVPGDKRIKGDFDYDEFDD